MKINLTNEGKLTAHEFIERENTKVNFGESVTALEFIESGYNETLPTNTKLKIKQDYRIVTGELIEL